MAPDCHVLRGQRRVCPQLSMSATSAWQDGPGRSGDSRCCAMPDARTSIPPTLRTIGYAGGCGVLARGTLTSPRALNPSTGALDDSLWVLHDSVEQRTSSMCSPKAPAFAVAVIHNDSDCVPSTMSPFLFVEPSCHRIAHIISELSRSLSNPSR